MNVQQFAKLKVGDAILNAMSNSRGRVVDVDRTGVRVSWSVAGAGGPTWHYSVHSTSWFHWELEEDSVSQPSASSETDAPQT